MSLIQLSDNFGEYLKDKRQQKYSAREMADLMGMDKVYYIEMERGKIREIHSQILNRIMEFLPGFNLEECENYEVDPIKTLRLRMIAMEENE